jgi:hypothetical protein
LSVRGAVLLFASGKEAQEVSVGEGA